MRDLDFISGRFFEYDVPKEKRFLLQYFKTDLQRAFLKYYMVFGEHRNFVDHTGYHCSQRLLFRFKARYHRLLEVYQEAKISLTEEGMETIRLLEIGKFPLTDI
jgi:hypothetical protein